MNDLAGGPQTCTLAEALDLVESGSVRLLTCDVFDTLVWRPVARPWHLFGDIARRLREQGVLADWVDDRAFTMGRRQLEHEARLRARRLMDSPECTLEEIWDGAPAAWWRGEPPPGAGIAAEMAAESDALRPHRLANELLRAAVRRLAKVVLVSDTYFSPEQLGDLLRHAGVELDGVEIVTSSQRRLNKWDGLLAAVVAEYGGPSGALHVGDNPGSDVETGLRVGVRVCHSDLDRRADAVANAHDPWTRASVVLGSDGGRSATVRETLNASGALGRDPSYQFGVAVAGPVMAGFAGWASVTAESLGARSVHCLLREGARIAELIEVVRPGGPRPVPVHASRWAILRAAVIEGSASELERALARRTDLRAEHVSEAFGCDTARVAAVIGGHTVPRDRRLDAYQALADDDGLRAEIVAASARQRANALSYLHATLDLEAGPLVLCDIGWGGTIQEGIVDILRSDGVTTEVVGLYALLSPPGELRAAHGIRMLGYLPTVGPAGASIPHARTAVRHPELLERINTPAIGTLLEFSDTGEPVTRPDDHDEIGESLRVAQRGVIDFCTTLADGALTDPRLRELWFGDPTIAAAALEALAAVIRAPDARLAAALGTWQHDDVAGTAAETLSAGSGLRRWLRYANAVDAAEIPMHDVFWVPGVAGAAGSAIAHQLEALAAGANPDVLCPPAPTGVARIAVFPPGSPLATAQTELRPRLGPEGWVLLQLTTAVPGLRSVRIDLGDTDLVADVADAQVVVRTDDGTTRTLVDDPHQLRSASSVAGGRWIGAGRVVVLGGGHLLVDLDEPLASSAEWVSVSIGYRAWTLDAETRDRLLPAWRAQTERVRLKLRARLARR